jgi:CRP-like cAMP-binding protein
MSDDAATVEQLRSVAIFATLADDDLRSVARVAAPFDVEPGHVLTEPHQAGSGMFVITDGTVEVELPGGPSIELGPGEFVGELSILADLDRVARVRSTSRVRGYAIARAAFEQLLREHPMIAVEMLPVVAKRLAELESRLG